MTTGQKLKIQEISMSFASGFKDTVGEIAGSGWLIADPLSGYLNFVGYENTPKQLPACDQHPQILILEFQDGTQFIPSGSDLKSVFPDAVDWMWIAPKLTEL